MKIKILFTTIFLSTLLLVNCRANKKVQQIEGTLSLMLQDGSYISQPNSDDYNPQLIQLADKRMLLIFGSNRAADGKYNIYAAVTAAPMAPGPPPLFNTPVVLNNAAGGGYSISKRFSFVVGFSDPDPQIHVIYTDPDNNDTIAGYSYDITSLESGAVSSADSYNSRTGTIVGFKKIISADGSVNHQVYFLKSGSLNYFVPESTTTSDVTATGPLLSTKSWFAYVPPQIAPDGSFFFTGWSPDGLGGGDLLVGKDANIIGMVEALTEKLKQQGMGMTHMNPVIFQNSLPTMVFSAGGPDHSANQNLYIVTFPDLFGLWQMGLQMPQDQLDIAGEDFGVFPDSVPGINLWLVAEDIFQGPGALTAWPSRLGDLTASTVVGSPVFNSMSTMGTPTVSFDASSYMSIPQGMTVGTVIAVTRLADGSSAYGTIAGDSTGILLDIDISGNILAPSGWSKSVNDQVATSSNPRPIYKIIAVSGVPVTSAGEVRIGNSGIGANYSGDIAELVFYDRQISPVEISSVIDYFLTKYHIPRNMPQTPYLSVDPALWLRADANITDLSGYTTTSFLFDPMSVTQWDHLLSAINFTANGTPVPPPLVDIMPPPPPNGPTGGPPPMPSKAFAFSSAGFQYFSTTGLGSTANMTLIAAYTPSAILGVNRVIYSNANGTTGGMDYGINASGNAYVTTYNGSAPDTKVFLSFVHEVNRPELITLTINSTALSLTVVGGVPYTATAGILPVAAGALNAAVGAAVGGSSFFDGSISEVLIFNSVLSTLDQQKAECYMAERTGLMVPHPCDTF